MREITFLPGPVAIYGECEEAFARPAFTHRSARFRDLINETERLVCGLAGTKYCTFLMGSATLANDAVAAQLSLADGEGLVVSNGEFGERLADQARRFGLKHEALSFPWGSPFDYEEVERRLAGKGWLWFANCETSTGAVNSFPRLLALCARRNVKVCVDAVSMLGCTPTDYSGAYLVSGTSGKGLGSFPGISFVLSNHVPSASGDIPRYLDLGYYRAKDLVPFTCSSNLLEALNAGVRRTLAPGRFERIARLGGLVEEFMNGNGISHAVTAGERASWIFTMVLPGHIKSGDIGAYMQERGILIHYRNSYLLERNWVQAALMGDARLEAVERLLSCCVDYFSRQKTPAKAKTALTAQ